MIPESDMETESYTWQALANMVGDPPQWENLRVRCIVIGSTIPRMLDVEKVWPIDVIPDHFQTMIDYEAKYHRSVSVFEFPHTLTINTDKVPADLRFPNCTFYLSEHETKGVYFFRELFSKSPFLFLPYKSRDVTPHQPQQSLVTRIVNRLLFKNH